MALHLLLSPLISTVAQKAGNSLIELFCQMHGMEKNREKLQRHLFAIQAVTADAESRGVKEPHVQAWLKELNAAAYKVEDVLDEFQYEALHQEAMRRNPASSFKKVTKLFNSDENPIFFRSKMSKKLNNLLEKINEIITEMQAFNFIPHDPRSDISRPPTHSYVDESEVIGRDGEKMGIMNMILDSNREMAKVSVLPIVGMGGAGKTTLAQLVYNENKVKGKFDMRMWVCVSNNFDIVNIVKSIIEVATSGQCVSTSNIEVLQNHLREILAGKKYLLVLDDVWNEEMHKWDALKTLLSSSASSGSLIIVTTRSKRVASIMGTLPPHDLAMLSEKDSWKLFQKRAFGEYEEIQQFVQIGQKIVNKCAGLPLALKSVGALMRYKREIHEWHAISENKIWNDEASTNEILPALKLSYDHLSNYMKQCFAFCAIFPQNYEIEKETLIQLWMANDFIPSNEISDLESNGRDIFDELCRRSFFQDIRQIDSRYLPETTICKMHDLMHDLAKHIAGQQCASMPEVESGSVLHLSILGYQSLDNINLNSILMEFPIIRTCLIDNEFVNKFEDRKLSDSLKLTPLRALEVRSINRLPKKIGFMKHLRYLDLSNGEFDFLPETVSALYNLQTLKLSNSNICELPHGTRHMIGLRHLFIDGCYKLKRMPIGLGQLRCLRTLTNYTVEYGIGRTIGEMKNLNLHGSLHLSGLENVKDRIEANAANLVSKTNLSFLTLEWGSQINNDSTTRNDQEVLDGLRPSSELKALSIVGYTNFDIPIWLNNMLSLRNLRKLSFRDSCNCPSLPPIWDLPLLEELVLQGMKSLVCLCGSKSIKDKKSEHLTMFQKLKKMYISGLDNLVGWHEMNDEMVAFPQLEELNIDFCPRIKTIPYAPLLKHLSVSQSRGIKLLQISNLTMAQSSQVKIHCESDVQPSRSDSQSESESFIEHDAFRPPKNVVKMYVSGFDNVMPLEEDEDRYQEQTLLELTMEKSNCFFSCGPSKQEMGFWKYFASLETLKIRECDALSLLPEREFRSLKCLKKLTILMCWNFSYPSEVSSSSTKSHGEDLLPRLDFLHIELCPMLVEIPRWSRSLKVLSLWNCPSVSKGGLNWLKNLHQLKDLRLMFCEGLESLPEGLESLISLQDLSICFCPEMESFPEGLQQRLSALQYLNIGGCPVLVRRCKSGGDYHHLISAIPFLSLRD